MPARERTRPRWSKWFWKDWLVKTQDLGPEARGAYIDLMGYAVTNSSDFCSVPNDDSILPYAARVRPERWRSLRARVLEARWELRADNRWEHPRLAEDACSWAKRLENLPVGYAEGATFGSPTGTPTAPHRARARALTSGSTSVEAEESAPSTNGKGKAEDSGSARGFADVAIPDWLPRPVWEDWCRYRAAKPGRAPWTERAAQLSIAKLGELMSLGHDPKAVVESSILNGYRGLFEPPQAKTALKQPESEWARVERQSGGKRGPIPS